MPVLFDVAFELRRGETLALLGTNGAGKSTVLRAISGLITPQRGVIRLAGQTITFVSPEQRLKLGIVSLTGGDGVFPSMSVSENLEMGAFTYRGEPAEVRDRVDRALEPLPEPGRAPAGRGPDPVGGQPADPRPGHGPAPRPRGPARSTSSRWAWPRRWWPTSSA